MCSQESWLVTWGWKPLMDGVWALWWARLAGYNPDSSKTPPRDASEDNTLSPSINVLLAFGPSPLVMVNKERTREINLLLILPFQQGPDPRLRPVLLLSQARSYFMLNHQFLGEQGTYPMGYGWPSYLAGAHRGCSDMISSIPTLWSKVGARSIISAGLLKKC